MIVSVCLNPCLDVYYYTTVLKDSDVISSGIKTIQTGKLTIELSSWQTYVGVAFGGAVGGVASLYTSPIGGGVIGGSMAATVTDALYSITGKEVDKETFIKDMAVGGFMGWVGGKVGNLVKIPKLTSGRGNAAAVFQAGLTKIDRGIAKRMSWKVIKKGVTAQFVQNLPGALINPIPQVIEDSLNGNFKINWLEKKSNKKRK